MREILFRAKRIDNNNWVYGYIYERDGHYYIVTLETEVEVIPDTVLQFTGLTDKNGVKIFEGDKTNYGTVLFKYGCFGIDGNNGFVEISNWNLSHVEIIGNIHNANV